MLHHSSREQDLRDFVLAEHVQVAENDKEIAITFDWLCPNCGHRHWATEIDREPIFAFLGVKLECGWCRVRMPWAETPERDTNSIYLTAVVAGEPIP